MKLAIILVLLMVTAAGASTVDVAVHTIWVGNTTYIWVTQPSEAVACSAGCTLKVPGPNETVTKIVSGNLTILQGMVRSMNNTLIHTEGAVRNATGALLTNNQATSLFEQYKSQILTDLGQRFTYQQSSLTQCLLNISRMNSQDLRIIKLGGDLNASQQAQGTAQASLTECQGINNNYFIIMLFELGAIIVLLFDHYGLITNIRRNVIKQ